MALVAAVGELLQQRVVDRPKVSVKPGVNRDCNLVLIQTGNHPLPDAMPFVSGIHVSADIREVDGYFFEVDDRTKAEATQPPRAKLSTHAFADFADKVID